MPVNSSVHKFSKKNIRYWERCGTARPNNSYSPTPNRSDHVRKNKKKAYFIKKTIRTLQLTNANILDEAITPTLITESKFDIVTARALASALKIIKMSKHLLSNEGKQGELKKQLTPLDYEFVIMDTPPSLNQLTLESLFAATATLIPLQCEYYSLEGISSLINTINTLKNKNLTENRVFGIIRTMVDMRNNLAKEVSEELEKHFPALVFNTLIPRNVKLAEAPSHGTSAIQYMPSSFGAKAYLALAGELIRRIEVGR